MLSAEYPNSKSPKPERESGFLFGKNCDKLFAWSWRGHLTVRVPHLTFGIEGFNTPWLHIKDHLKTRWFLICQKIKLILINKNYEFILVRATRYSLSGTAWRRTLFALQSNKKEFVIGFIGCNYSMFNIGRYIDQIPLGVFPWFAIFKFNQAGSLCY